MGINRDWMKDFIFYLENDKIDITLTVVHDNNIIPILETAIKMNKPKSIEIILNHYNVPENLTLKERIAYFQLLGDMEK